MGVKDIWAKGALAEELDMLSLDMGGVSGKIGETTDAAADAPTSLFSGIKRILQWFTSTWTAARAAKVDTIETNMTSMKTDVTLMNAAVNSANTTLATVNSNVSTIKSNVSSIFGKVYGGIDPSFRSARTLYYTVVRDSYTIVSGKGVVEVVYNNISDLEIDGHVVELVGRSNAPVGRYISFEFNSSIKIKGSTAGMTIAMY